MEIGTLKEMKQLVTLQIKLVITLLEYLSQLVATVHVNHTLLTSYLQLSTQVIIINFDL